MDVIIPDSWLREFLDTTAKPKKIAECLSLCGSSFERIQKIEGESVYHIEITTNRVDLAGIVGIAREAAAILPRFKIGANLKDQKIQAKQKLVPGVSYLEPTIDHTLCSRFTAILIRDIKYHPSPQLMQRRLKQVGIRPLNNVVDISNYLMREMGQPVHTFDYDKITGEQMILRKSKRGEKLTTLDGKKHTLPGDDIVIEDGQGQLIDLAGIMGGLNSAVSENTKNVLLFVQTYNPVNIRRTSIKLSHRTEAVSLFEKNLDPELVEPTIRRGIDLFVEIAGGKPDTEILDIYPDPYKGKSITTTHSFVTESLGVSLDKKEIADILNSLGFVATWKAEKLQVRIPSWRSSDMGIEVDIVEEVARLYGYHNLPTRLMSGITPDPLQDPPFSFETKVKQILKGLGGVEVYTLSLTSKDKASVGSIKPLKLKNPLGNDSAYLRTTLGPSLVWAAGENLHEKESFHLFEMANVYLPKKGGLPDERMTLAGIFSNHDFRLAKGIVETLIEELNAQLKQKIDGSNLELTNGLETVGRIKILEDGSFYYEFDMELLKDASSNSAVYIPIPKYPPQVEDISLIVPGGVYMSNVIEEIYKSDTQISSIKLIDIYNDSKTLRITYQNPDKTLTNPEVAKIRNAALSRLKQKFGAKIKE